MTDLDKALAAARDRLSQYEQTPDNSLEETMAGLDCIESLRDILAALDAARGQAVAWQVTVVDNTGTHDYAKWAGLQAPPAAAVPEEGLRDSVLNSAKFRASCYALVGIVEGIEGLGRNWAANGERLKDTREWVAFYNCVAAMRNRTFNQASAAPAQQPAALAVPDGWQITTDQKLDAIWLHLTGPNGRVSFSVTHGTYRSKTLQEFAAALAERNKENNNE